MNTTDPTRPAALAVEDLVKLHRDHTATVRAVDGVSLDVPRGSFFTLLGPSGCGKTTTLRCIAGLEKIDGGSITLNGNVLAAHQARRSVPAHRRGIGMVFQSYAIWPHMTVAENVAFPLKIMRPRRSRAQIAEAVEQALIRVQLAGLESRMATRLSGGQQQRLALARALVGQPQLLLLDEPLSNLDARLRDHMRVELRALLADTGITAIYVTHDQVEALSMSTHIAVMREGRVVQQGTPEQIYRSPATGFVADFVGRSNFMNAEFVARTPDADVYRTPLGELHTAPSKDSLGVGDARRIAIRPENITVSMRAGTNPNTFAATVENATFVGDALEYHLRCGEELLFVRAHPSAKFAVGTVAYVELAAEHLVALPTDAIGAVREERSQLHGKAQQ